MSTSAALRPRYLLRRLLALFIDSVLFYGAAGLIVALVSAVVPGIENDLPRLLPTVTSCNVVESSNSPISREIAQFWAQEPNAIRAYAECSLWSPLMPTMYFTMAEETVSTATSSFTRSLGVQHDAQGQVVILKPIVTQTVQSLLILLFPLSLALAASRWRASPGKRMASLMVTRQEDSFPCDPLPMPVALRREYLKFVPLILFTAFNFSAVLAMSTPGNLKELVESVDGIKPEMSPIVASLVLPQILLSVFIFGWWVVPFLRWRGQTFYDRLAGCKVVESRR